MTKKHRFFKLLFFLFCSVFLFIIGCESNSGTPTKTSEYLINHSSKSPESAASASLSTKSPLPDDSPTPSSGFVLDTMMLHVPFHVGDRGDEIAFIQYMLTSLGFDPGDINGEYGEKLHKTIRDFQLYVGLTVDGIVGAQTLSALAEHNNNTITSYSQINKPLEGHIIGIDPGHQRNDNSETEPVKPGSDDYKKKVSSGTCGRFTRVSEYVINLQVGLKLKTKLESLGAVVIMTREAHDVDISNAERALMMNEAGVDCWLRIHANGSDDPGVHGMFILVAEKGFMNTSSDSVYKTSAALAKTLLNYTVKETGANNLGVMTRTDQTGFGWSSVPVCNIEMGHLTNENEDFLLVSETYQNSIADGLCSGFLEYFKDF